MEKLKIGEIYRTTVICIQYPMTGYYAQYIFKDEVENLLISFLSKYDICRTFDVDFNTGISGDYVRFTFNNDLITETKMINICNEAIDFLYDIV